MVERATIAIVGAGLSGLSCAYYLEKLGYSPIIFETKSEPGGRCATDFHEGYLLDKGFQVILTSYPEIKNIVRLYELDLKPFPSGANIYDGKNWNPIHNPLKHPLSIFELRKIPFAFFSDYVKLGSIYMKSAFKTGNPLFNSIGQTTSEFLADQKLSAPFIDKFLRPFFSGVFLDPELSTNPGIFQWLLHFFVEGSASLPRKGMHAIPRLLAKKLEKTQIRYQSPVRAIEGRSVFLDGGEEILCEKIVVALDAPDALALLPKLPPVESRSVTCLYYALDADDIKSPLSPLLHLNGTHEGPINNLAFLSLVQPSYAPKRKVLASASIINTQWQTDPNVIQSATEQLAEWFKIPTAKWEFIKRYTIPHALPDQTEPPLLQGRYIIERSPDIFLCGEYVDNASLNGACASGRKVADAVHEAKKING